MKWDPGSQGKNLNNTGSDQKVDYSEMSSQPVHIHRSVELDDILEESSIEEESLPLCDSDTTPDSSSPFHQPALTVPSGSTAAPATGVMRALRTAVRLTTPSPRPSSISPTGKRWTSS